MDTPQNELVSVDRLAAALAKAQGKFPPIVKNKTAHIRSDNGNFEYKYADLDSFLCAIRPALSENGLAIVQIIDGPRLLTQLIHSSGQLIESCMTVGDVGPDPRTFGSRLTYLRRYSVSALCGVASDDDDDAGGGGGGAEGYTMTDAEKAQSKKPDAKKEPPAYSPEAFKANFPAWEKAITEGKRTHQQIFALIESKAKLTDEQRKQINDIKAPAKEEPATQESAQ